MSIKDIFTIVDVYDETIPAARLAIDFARRAEAHVTGLALAMEPLAPGFLASPIPADYIVGALEEAERQAKAAAGRFQAACRDAGVDGEARTVTVLAGSTQPIVGQTYLTDLVVVGQEDLDKPEPMRGVLIEALLFETGVPALVVPSGYARSLGTGKAVVAWDGSATAARAVHASIPLLCTMAEVEVTIVASDRAWMGEPGSDVAIYLARHGVHVSVNTVNRDAGDVAGTLMARADEIGADLMVMGAYGHSRLREFIIGGATRGILERMRIPTLMTH